MKSKDVLKIAVDAWRAGDHGRCIHLCRKVLKADPANPDALHILAIVAHGQGQFGGALGLFQKALKQSPNNAEYFNNMGITLHKLKRYQDQEQAFRTAIRLAPENRDYLNNLAVCLLHQGAVAESAAYQQKCIDLGGNTTQYHNLGLLLRRLDRLEEAEQAQLEALRQDPGFTAAWLYLVQLRNYTDPDHPDIRTIWKLLEVSGKPPVQDAELRFALGKCFEDCGLYEQSFEHYQSANRIMAGQLTYERIDQKHYVDALTRDFARPGIWEHRLDLEDGPAPLFIVGMSRTGKTRLERLLAMRPDVHRGGEMFALPELAMRRCQQEFGKTIPEHPSREVLLAAARQYREFIKAQAPGKRYMTDSLPANIRNLGLATLLFPDARIIHLQRDPEDTLISIYLKYYGRGSHAYTYQLEGIRTRQEQYSRLIETWQQLLPVSILMLRYEDLVRDPAGTAGKVAEFCGLEVSSGDRENWQSAGLNDRWIGRAGRFREYLEAAWSK